MTIAWKTERDKALTLNSNLGERTGVRGWLQCDDDFMSANCDAIVIFPNHGQFGAIRKFDFGRVVCKTYTFIKSNFLSYKNWKQN